MNIAIIPARGGSKRIPRKNIRIFLDKPIIAWSIEAALKSGLFDRVIVSTDDMEIAQCAISYGAEVPFTRPKELANDFVGNTEVLAHAVKWLIENMRAPKYVCCIYATSPFLSTTDLARGFYEIDTGRWNYCFSATNFPSTIYRSFLEIASGGVQMLYPDNFEARSQDLPDALYDAAQFYWGKAESWLNLEDIFNEKSKPIFIPRWRVQDIDNEDDWLRAELIAPQVFSNSIR
jgi:N-acylneuraminate cytidylyltransferase